MEYFKTIQLKPLSSRILHYLYDRPPMQTGMIAAGLQEKERAVSAAVTKALVRYGFVQRVYQLTRVMKREYALITITDLGKRYIEFLQQEEKEENLKGDIYIE